MAEVEIGDGGGGVGVDDNHLAAAVSVEIHADARNAVPFGELLGAELLSFGVTNFNEVEFRVRDDQHGEGDADKDADNAPVTEAGEAEPDGGGGGKKNGDRDDCVGSAERVEQQDQDEAASGRAQQIEEINPVDALDGFRDHEGDDDSGAEKGQRGHEIDQAEFEVADFGSAGEDEQRRGQHEGRVDEADGSQFAERRTGPAGNQIGQNAADAQSEQRDRDGEKREVVIKNHRKNPR